MSNNGYRYNANDSSRKTDKAQFYKLIKKKHIFPSIMGLIITYCFVVIVAIIVFEIVVSFLTDFKLETEYKSISSMSMVYEKATDKANAIQILEEEDREFIILDKQGNIIYPVNRANISCSFKGGMVEVPNVNNMIEVFYDKKENSLDISNNELGVLLKPTFSKIYDKGIFSSLFSNDEDQSEKSVKGIPLNFWISIGFGDGSGTIIGKASYEINNRDIAFVFILVLAIGFIAVILFFALIIRIVKRFVRQKKLLAVFFTDVVTKGHNWMWFTIKGEEHIQKRKNDKLNFAVLNLSVVKFNTYCVCHSVEEGNMVLQKIHKMISVSINKYEACAHHGTASFAVLLQYANEDVLKKKVKFILKHLENVEPSHKFAYHVGIALLPAIAKPNGSYVRRTDIDMDLIYNNACAASATLESSDDTGIAFFDNKLVEEQKWIDIVTEKQKSAIENEEFVIFYQPKYNPATDELRGAEALIRWQSPEYGFVTPGRIIPIYEKNGSITEIDHYMITHVARDQKKWLDAGFKCVPVSVNVSRAHFIESDLAEQIRDAVDNEGAPRELIEIELTESAFFDDKNALLTTINKLKSYGFKVSMDDFGAGYSSLNSLKDMPLDVLKLDADFFRGENEDGRGEIVVSEAIKLAKALNMHTVAEGVEVREQVDFLAKQGCDMIQGYYYAKPMPGDEYEQRMRQNADKAKPEVEAEIVVYSESDDREAAYIQKADIKKPVELLGDAVIQSSQQVDLLEEPAEMQPDTAIQSSQQDELSEEPVEMQSDTDIQDQQQDGLSEEPAEMRMDTDMQSPLQDELSEKSEEAQEPQEPQEPDKESLEENKMI